MQTCAWAFVPSCGTDPYARDVVAARVVVGGGGASLGAGTHGKTVVLAHEHAGQVPQLGHVVGLEDLALVGRPVSIEGQAHPVRALVLVAQGNAGT